MNNKYKNFTTWTKAQKKAEYQSCDWTLIEIYVATIIICSVFVAEVLS